MAMQFSRAVARPLRVTAVRGFAASPGEPIDDTLRPYLWRRSPVDSRPLFERSFDEMVDNAMHLYGQKRLAYNKPGAVDRLLEK